MVDFTYCSTWSGIVYVAFVVDAFSRRIVGWKASRTILFTSGGAAGETALKIEWQSSALLRRVPRSR